LNFTINFKRLAFFIRLQDFQRLQLVQTHWESFPQNTDSLFMYFNEFQNNICWRCGCFFNLACLF
jgi:hypothetical protein